MRMLRRDRHTAIGSLNWMPGAIKKKTSASVAARYSHARLLSRVVTCGLHETVARFTKETYPTGVVAKKETFSTAVARYMCVLHLSSKHCANERWVGFVQHLSLKHVRNA